MENKKLLAIYVGIADTVGDSNDFLESVTETLGKIIDENNYTTIIIPRIDSSTIKIECIDPQYITKEELIKENEKALLDLTKKIIELI